MRAAEQLDGADPASQMFGFHAILALAGRAAHLEAVRRQQQEYPPMKFKFASAAPSEPTIFGAQRPAYDYHSVGQDMIVEWTDFMQTHGIRRVCCLLPKEQLAFYSTDLLASYRKSFGSQNLCHVEVQDLHLIDLADLENTILPFLREWLPGS